MSAEAEEEVIFRGELIECLRHIGLAYERANPKGTKGARRAREPLAAFCGVQESTVFSWFHGVAAPVSAARIKIMCLLEVMGYEVLELRRLKEAFRGVAEIVGLGVMSPEEVQERLGFSRVHHVFEMIHGGRGLSQEKDEVVWNLWKANRSAIEEKRKKLKQRFGRQDREDRELKPTKSNQFLVTQLETTIRELKQLRAMLTGEEGANDRKEKDG